MQYFQAFLLIFLAAIKFPIKTKAETDRPERQSKRRQIVERTQEDGSSKREGLLHVQFFHKTETKKEDRKDRRDRSGREDKTEIEKNKTEEERQEIGEARKKTEKEWKVLSKQYTTKASTASKGIHIEKV